MSGRHIPIGKITGLFGVAGWVKVYSYTRPQHNIIQYCGWRLSQDGNWSALRLLESARRHGGGVIAKFSGIDDRSAAAALVGHEVAVEEAQFERLPSGEYYWFQLLGLEVINGTGQRLGRVKHLLETNANDVLVVEDDAQRHLIPYVRDTYVKAVDLEAGHMQVDWQAVWRS